MEKALKEAKGSWWQRVCIIEGGADVWNVIKQEAPETAHCSCVAAVCLGWCPKPRGQKLSDFSVSGSGTILSEYNVCSLAVIGLWNLENETGKAFRSGYFPGTHTMPPACAASRRLRKPPFAANFPNCQKPVGLCQTSQMPWFGSQWQAADEELLRKKLHQHNA